MTGGALMLESGVACTVSSAPASPAPDTSIAPPTPLRSECTSSERGGSFDAEGFGAVGPGPDDGVTSAADAVRGTGDAQGQHEAR